MKDRPLILSGPSVQATEEGRKTETRRVLSSRRHSATSIHEDVAFHPTADGRSWIGWYPTDPGPEQTARLYPSGGIACPYGVPGDRLWVRETWAPLSALRSPYDKNPGARALAEKAVFRSDYPPSEWGSLVTRWSSPIFMPRTMARLVLDVVAVRVERLHALTEDGARAEGVRFFDGYWCGAPHRIKGTPLCLPTAREAYASVWDHLNGHRDGCRWEDNPWVWVVGYRRLNWFEAGSRAAA